MLKHGDMDWESSKYDHISRHACESLAAWRGECGKVNLHLRHDVLGHWLVRSKLDKCMGNYGDMGWESGKYDKRLRNVC